MKRAERKASHKPVAVACTRLLAVRIINGLDRVELWKDKQAEADSRWISRRYADLRMTHEGGFGGASVQARTEFVEMVLNGGHETSFVGGVLRCSCGWVHRGTIINAAQVERLAEAHTANTSFQGIPNEPTKGE